MLLGKGSIKASDAAIWPKGQGLTKTDKKAVKISRRQQNF